MGLRRSDFIGRLKRREERVRDGFRARSIFFGRATQFKLHVVVFHGGCPIGCVRSQRAHAVDFARTKKFRKSKI